MAHHGTIDIQTVGFFVDEEARIALGGRMDWTGCELVERVPGKVSGQPIVRGTRIMPEAIIGDYELGASLEEIQEDFPSLTMEKIKELIRFAQSRQSA